MTKLEIAKDILFNLNLDQMSKVKQKNYKALHEKHKQLENEILEIQKEIEERQLSISKKKQEQKLLEKKIDSYPKCRYIPVNIPFAQKEQAKRDKLQWDPFYRTWFIDPEIVNMHNIVKYLEL